MSNEFKCSTHSDDCIWFKHKDYEQNYDDAEKEFTVSIPGQDPIKVVVEYDGDWNFSIHLPDGSTVTPIDEEEA